MLETQGLGIRFGGVQAVSDVSISFQAQSVHAIIGPNGAGKTTFFHLLSGVYQPTEGRIFFNGRDITALGPAERVQLGIARSYQRTNIFPNLSLRDNLRLAALRAEGQGWSFRPQFGAPKAGAVVEEVLDLLQLTPHADTPAETLPYGVQRLIDIGIALCCQPKVLLLDEPTSGLSTAELRETVSVLRRLRERVTLLLIEHNMELVVGLAERISVLNFGTLLANGRPEEVAANQEVQRAYFGTRKGGLSLGGSGRH